MPFPSIIPDDEKISLDVRRFADHVQNRLSSLLPRTAAPAPPLPDAAQAAPAMPEALPAPPGPPPAPPPDAQGVAGPPAGAPSPGAASPLPPPMQGGFDPGMPPPPDPQAQADQFAQYVASHPAMQQQAPPMPETPAMPQGLPAPPEGLFGAADANPMATGPEGDRPASEFDTPQGNPDDAQRFADYTKQTAGIDPSQRMLGPEGLTQTDVSRVGVQVPVPGPAEIRSAALGVGNAVGGAMDALGGQIQSNIVGMGQDVQDLTALSQKDLGIGVPKEPLTPEENRRVGELSANYGLALTGEPLATSGGEAASKTASAAAGEIARLQLDKVPEAVRDTVQAAAQSGDFWKTQRRGVIPDAQAQQMADELGLSVDKIIKAGKAGKAYNEETTLAIRNAVVAQAMKVNELATQIRQDPTSAGPGLIAQQLAEGLKLADLTRVAEGARAEAGRSLRAYQAFARDYAADPTSAVQRIFASTNLTPEQATQKVAVFQKMVADGAGPIEMAKFWANIEKPPPGIQDWFSLVRYNSMLSGPRTLEVNTLGNLVEIPWRLTRDTVASLAKGNPREMQAEAAGTWEGFRRGIRAFGEVAAHGITAEQAARGEVPRSISTRIENPVGKTVATGLELPMRLMGATDELFHQLAYGMAMGRQAALKASEEGLSGRAMAARASELFDNPTVGMMTAAGSVADRMTYHGQMGPIGQFLEKGQQIPLLGNLVLPFVRTVVHITNRGLDLTPIGAARTAFDVGVRGAGRNGYVPAGMAPLGERVPDNIVGTMGFALLGYLASQGVVSGAGPQDPALRDTLRATGWRPYSVKVGDQWVSYQNWGPFAIPLSLAAAWPEAQRYAGPHTTTTQQVADGFRRGAAILADQGMLAGVGALYKGATEPDRFGTRWIEQVMQSLVPYGGAANTVAQSMDPYERRPPSGDIPAAVQSRIPSTPLMPGRQDLPVAQDAMGRPIPNEASGLGSLVPSRTSSDRPDPVVGALLDAGLAIPEPPPDAEGIPLNEDDKRVYREATGAELQRLVAARIAQPSWETTSPANRNEILRDLIRSARLTGRDAAYKSAKARGSAKPTPAPPRSYRP